MGAVGRIILIVFVVLLVAVGAGYFLLPNSASRTETLAIERPAPTVFARLASTPAGTTIAEGVTLTEVTSAADNVVVANVAYADGATGRVTYTVAPEGEGSSVRMKLEQDLGSNPIARFTAIGGGPVTPVIEAAAASVTADLNQLPNASFEGLQYTIEQVAARPFIYNQNCSPTDPAEIREAVAQSLVVLRPLLARYNLTQDGPPIAVETSWDEANNQYCFQIGYAFTGRPPRIYAGGSVGETPAGTAVRVTYQGTEEEVLPLYTQMEALIAAARLTQGRSFEIYHDDATQTGGSINREVFYMVEGDTARLTELAPPTAAPPPAAEPAASGASTPETPEAAQEPASATP